MAGIISCKAYLCVSVCFCVFLGRTCFSVAGCTRVLVQAAWCGGKERVWKLTPATRQSQCDLENDLPWLSLGAFVPGLPALGLAVAGRWRQASPSLPPAAAGAVILSTNPHLLSLCQGLGVQGGSEGGRHLRGRAPPWPGTSDGRGRLEVESYWQGLS